MKRMMALMTVMALTILTACDPDSRADSRAEQSDRLYKAAMEDYRSGRMDAATKGFEKLLAKDPANASARFQFACLLQDVRHDFCGAYCAYREYLLQRPDSDKVKLAKDRMAMCEKEFAKELADRYGLAGSGAATEELNAVRQQLKAAEARVAASEKNLADSLRRIRALSEEKDRLLNVVKGVGGGAETAAAKPSVKEVRELLEEDEESAPLTAPAGEFASLLKDDKDGEASQSSLLPKQPEVKPSKKVEEKDDSASEKAKPALPERPKTYVVQEGDTLYGVAKRFYGNISAWKQIRDANKAVISTDNRLRAGDTIVLPEP